MLLEIRTGSGGFEIRLNCPYQKNILQAVKMNSNETFKLQIGRPLDSTVGNIKTYHMDIGVFQATLFTFWVSMFLNSVWKIFKLLFSPILL